MEQNLTLLTTLSVYKDDLIRARNKLKWYQFKKRRNYNKDIKKYQRDIDYIFECEILKL